MTSELEQAREFAELFRAVYLAFHRRDEPRSQLPNASFAVLEHLALAARSRSARRPGTCAGPSPW